MEVSLTTAIPFSFHLFSTSSTFAGILHGVQESPGRPVDLLSFSRRNSLLDGIQEFSQTDPNSFVCLFPLRGQPQIQSPGIMLRLFLDDQSPPDKRADHPGGSALFHREDIVEFCQLNDASSSNVVKDEELGKSQVQTERLFLLTAPQGPGKFSDEGKDFLVGLRHGLIHGCIIQLYVRPVKTFFLL